MGTLISVFAVVVAVVGEDQGTVENLEYSGVAVSFVEAMIFGEHRLSRLNLVNLNYSNYCFHQSCDMG